MLRACPMLGYQFQSHDERRRHLLPFQHRMVPHCNMRFDLSKQLVGMVIMVGNDAAWAAADMRESNGWVVR